MKNALVIDNQFNFPGKDVLSNKGYHFKYLSDIESALKKSAHSDISGVLISFDLIKHNIVSILRDIKTASADKPLIVYAADNDELNTILMIEAGADEVLSKDMNTREAQARVMKLFNIYQKLASFGTTTQLMQTECIHIHEFKLYPGSYEISKNEQVIELTPREFFTLLFLYENRGEIVTREDIMKELKNTFGKTSGNKRITDMFISNIRNKLGLDCSTSFNIVTVRGRGYYLKFNSPT
ncbi:response regulator transcription factor [Planococcus lenghuensis]|uniref:OmpR/PhoB-type domain-containing protein n=1 Tax=Planococcus lenghuensis TaxID=2213202 RepID=A0A1Q2KZX5_9BACL|nr:response regulator transcription factor [Planococcus lenghuensis]AQQ53192.1 hypothetical protein B0X71_08910 [Planococcus lenghuensis]